MHYRIGVSGLHRTGKTTFAKTGDLTRFESLRSYTNGVYGDNLLQQSYFGKTLAEVSSASYVDFNVRGVAQHLNIPNATHLDYPLRKKFQLALLEHCKSSMSEWDIVIGPWVTDRTPLCLATYMLADKNTPYSDTWTQEYVNTCMSYQSMFSKTIVMLRQVAPVDPSVKFVGVDCPKYAANYKRIMMALIDSYQLPSVYMLE